MSDLSQFFTIKTFQWSLPGAENPRLAAPISASATSLTVTNAPKDEDGNIITGDFQMGIKDVDGYTESVFVPSGTLAYDAQTANFTVGKILTGGTSNATALIIADSDSGTTGTLTLAFVSGTFQNDETITDNNSTPGSATSNGTLTNSVSADGITISNLVRGADLAGLDPTTANTTANAVVHDQDNPVFSQVSAINFTMMENALKGAINSGGANWKIGKEVDEDITIFAANGDTNEPFWRYDSATSAWVFSNDGVSSTPFGTGAGVTGGDGITVTAGDIDIDTSDTVIFATGATANRVPLLDGSGNIQAAQVGATNTEIAQLSGTTNIAESNTFFGATNITGAEAETLTDGSDASTLHIHAMNTGQVSRATGVTGTFTIAHGLGVTPRLIQINAMHSTSAGISFGTATSTTDETCTFNRPATENGVQDSTHIVFISVGANDQSMTVSALDATNITLNHDVSASDGVVLLQFTAFA